MGPASLSAMTDVIPPRRPPVHDMALHRPRRLPRWWWAPVAVLGVGLLGWWMMHPQDLPADADGASTTTKTGQPVFVGLTTDDGTHRSPTIRGIELGEVPDGATVEVLVCRGGSVTITSDAASFCEQLVRAEGTDLDLPEDQLLVSVSSDEPGTLSLDGLGVSFREGVQWGSHGLPDVTVEVVG